MKPAAALAFALTLPSGAGAHTPEQFWLDSYALCMLWNSLYEEAKAKAVSENFKEETYTFEDAIDARDHAIKRVLAEFFLQC